MFLLKDAEDTNVTPGSDADAACNERKVLERMLRIQAIGGVGKGNCHGRSS